MYLCPTVANERKGSLRVMYRAELRRISWSNTEKRSFLLLLLALFFCTSSFVTDVAKALEILDFIILY